MVLQRTYSTFIYPTGVRRNFSILQDNPATQAEPASDPQIQSLPEVTLTFQNRRRVSRRDRFAHLEIDDLISLFCSDFGIRPRYMEGSLLDEGFSITFYRGGGQGGDINAANIIVDPATWYELLDNITRIDVRKPDSAMPVIPAAPATPIPAVPFWYKHASAFLPKFCEMALNAAMKQIFAAMKS